MKSNRQLQTRQMLKSANLYCTKCRVEILKLLAAVKKPLSQNQIDLRVGKKHLNKVTIYRTLQTFCEVGLVHKAFIQQRTWHFELANHCSPIQCHPHFTCKDCGATHCLFGLSVPIVKGLKKGFVIHRQQVRLEGLCPACA